MKTLRVDAMGHGEQEFMREARIMVTLNHPCIVKLIGVTKAKPLMLVGYSIPTINGGVILFTIHH